MKYDEIKKQIQDSAEQIPIPDSLKPEQIKNLLPEDDSRKPSPVSRKTIFSVGTLAAAALLLFIALEGNLISSNTNSSSAPEAIADGIAGDFEMVVGEAEKTLTAEGMRNPASYEELYQLLFNYEEENRWNYDDVIMESADAGTAAGSGEVSSINQDYSETNVQVQGVDEGDIIKTDGKYIYMLNQGKGCLQILTAERGSITLLTEIYPPAAQPDNSDASVSPPGAATTDIGLANHYGFTELYLHENLLVLIRSSWQLYPEAITEDSDYYSYHYSKNFTETFVYDISNPDTPKLLSTLNQDGGYQSSRKVNDFLYVFSHHYAILSDGIQTPEYYVPVVGETAIPANCIFLPEEIAGTGYLVITAIDLKESAPGFSDQLSVLANSQDYYVSSENIYVTSYSYQSDNTEIMKFAYANGKVTPAADGKIDGWLNNSFSMDEYGGFLRAVTTSYGDTLATSPISPRSSDDTINQLIILNDRLEVISTISDIAKGETVYSARFMGTTAYFVTFRQVDPLFCVDLSNPYEPKISGELKVTGFSNYLHPYEENLLLGLGYEADETGVTQGIKLSMFDVSDSTDIKEVHKLVLPDGQYSPGLYNHKAVLISPEENIIGFMVDGARRQQNQYDWFMEYRTFSYDSEQGFSEDIIHALGTDQYYYTESRGLYIGEYLYIVGEENNIYIYNRMSSEYVDKWENLQ